MGTCMGDNVHYDVADGVATVRIDRPDKLNALTLDMWRAIADGMRRAERDEVRVAVLTGTGRAFCTGDDIGALDAIDGPRDVRELTSTILDCFGAVENTAVPVVGKANGSAYGGGFELLLACDLTVAPADATFALPEAKIGAYPFYGAKRLARMVGRQRAADVTMAGRELSGREAVEWGLFARAVDEDDLDEAAADVVAGLKKASPVSLEMTKSYLNASLEFAGEDDAMRAGLGYLFAGEDAHEGAAAFMEKREPDYAE